MTCPPRGADGALDTDCAQPPLDLGARRGGEHHARGGQGNERQGDQQIDDDAGGLVEQDSDPGASGEPDVTETEAGRAGLDEELVDIARVANPDLGKLTRWVALGAEASGSARCGQCRSAAWRAETRRCRAPRPIPTTRSGPELADIHGVAGPQPPGLRERPLDQHLVAGRAQVASVNDGVAAPGAGPDHLGDRVIAPMPGTKRPDPDVRHLVRVA